MPTHPHVGWGLLISLCLHASGIAALSLALPRLNVRPGVVRQVEFAVLEAPEQTTRAAATSAPPLAAAAPDTPEHAETAARQPAPLAAAGATVELSVEPERATTPQPSETTPQPSAAPVQRSATPLRAANPARKPVTKPLAAASPRELSSATHADPHSDGSALQRVLTQIAATTELTPDERRKAMLVVLRTWEDPSGKHSAEELIDALLKDARKARTAAPQEQH